MITTFLVLVILFLIFLWSVAWIKYYNRLDKRFGDPFGDIVMTIMW